MATTNLSHFTPEDIPSGSSRFSIALVVSQWNSNITERLLAGAKETLLKAQVKEKNIDTFYVPGSFELIFACNRLAQSDSYDAIIAIGSVIRGETPHFDFVCSAVAHGIKDCNTKGNSPVIFCVLTDNTLEQALDRSGGRLGNKGVEAAIAALKMAELNRKL